MRHKDYYQQSYMPFKNACARIERVAKTGKMAISMTVTVAGSYNPGYPTPPCSDHDHPNFSDPGSPPDIDVHEITSVEDVEFDCLEDLSKDDQTLLDAIEKAWDSQYRQHKEGNKSDAIEGKQLACWLEELLAARHGLGPWSKLEFTWQELSELEEQASEYVGDEEEYERRQERRLFGDNY